MKTIETLTAEQEAQAGEFMAQWRRQNLTGEPTDRLTSEYAIHEFYSSYGAKKPHIVWCASPFQLLVIPLILQHFEENGHVKAQPLRADLFERLNCRFNMETWSQMEEALWSTVEITAAKLSHNGVTIDDYGILALYSLGNEGEPAEGLEANTSLHFQPMHQLGSASSSISLNSQVSALTTRMFSRVNARLDNLLVQRLRGEVLQVDRPFPWQRNESNRSGNHVNIINQLVATLLRQCERRTGLGDEFGAINNRTWWGIWEHDWLRLYQFIRQHIACDFFEPPVDRRFNIWLNLARGAVAYQFYKGVCFVCEQPRIVQLDERSRLHNDSGSALVFPDGYSIYSWHGVTVDSYVIEQPDQITVDDIEQEENSEVRRVKTVRFGESKYLQNSAHDVIDESSYGTLYQKQVPGDEALVMVRVKNSTPEPDGTFKHYFLRVPPSITTARQAVAWTFGLEPDDYQPLEES